MRKFIIRSNHDGTVWVSIHRWLLGNNKKATTFSDPFYAQKVVDFELKSEAGRSMLPTVYELLEDGSVRIVKKEDIVK